MAYNDRHDLFLKKIGQCTVVFDFNDASSELEGKEIKREALTEILEYITGNRGVITEQVYPAVVNMVCRQVTALMAGIALSSPRCCVWKELI